MTKRIKKFFVFLFFSLFFSLLSGKTSGVSNQKGETVSGINKGWNSASAGVCCPNEICEDEDGKHYCC